MRNFDKAKRIVIKIGTNTLSKGFGVDKAYIRRIARQVDKLLKDDRQVVIVTSGAIGMGAGQLKIDSQIKTTKMRQACAAIGQPVLMEQYRRALTSFGVNMAQVLLTAEVLNNRKTYLNLKTSMETLLSLDVVPIVNENDCVSTDEIGTAFGDNDKLSALVASKLDADLLIILSDIDAFYDKDPRKHDDAKPIDAVFEINQQIMNQAGKQSSTHSTGGMKTKIEAAKIASNAGCRIVIANGREKNILPRILAGHQLGTVFMPKRKLSNRTRWILNSTATGEINIDQGAVKALRNHKSLLPSGIVSVHGSFKAGDVVAVNGIAKAVSSLASSDLKAVIGKHSTKIREILGPDKKDVVATPEDIVLIDY